MVKTTTLKRPKKSGKKLLVEHVPFNSKILKNSSTVAEVLLDCIRSGDLETFRDVLYTHLMTVNKVALAKKAGIGRRTLYDLIDPKKDFNPELSTISALIQAMAA
ncbi:MAG: hypothetical protein H7177_00880 [Rhizobacter sp.]|nr:hypothetical protein [Bacteriovorax sp.]